MVTGALLAAALVGAKAVQLHFWSDPDGHRLWPGLLRQGLLGAVLLTMLARSVGLRAAARQAGFTVDRRAAGSLFLLGLWAAALIVASSASGPSVLNLVLVTALGEEALFRGLLPAILDTRRPTRLSATALSSVAFGLWHLPDAWPGPVPALLGTVAATTAAAVIVFAPLRRRTGSVYFPAVVHAVVNGAALLVTRW